MKRLFYTLSLFLFVGFLFFSIGAIANQSLATLAQVCETANENNCNGCSGAFFDPDGTGPQVGGCFEMCTAGPNPGGGPPATGGPGRCAMTTVGAQSLGLTPRGTGLFGLVYTGSVPEGGECWVSTDPQVFPAPGNHECSPGLWCKTRNDVLGFTPTERASFFPDPAQKTVPYTYGSQSHTITYKTGKCVNTCSYNAPTGGFNNLNLGDSTDPNPTCTSSQVCLPDVPFNSQAQDYDSYGGICVSKATFGVPTGQVCAPSNSSPRGNCRRTSDICTKPGNPSSTSPAICLPGTYSCGSGLNEYGCPDPMKCGKNLYPGCERDPNQDYCKKCFFPEDLQFRCHCNNPGQAQAGKNDFGCDNYVGDVIRGWCDDSDEACWEITNADGGEGLDISEIHVEEPPRSSDRFLGSGEEHWWETAWDSIRNFFAYDNNDFEATGQSISCSTQDPRVSQFVEPNEAPCEKRNADGTCAQILTAFGPVSTDPVGFISSLFGILLGTAGMIAVLLIMRAGYRIMTARGNPESIKEGREQIVAAIVGLMFLIFSFVLLQVIGVDLLRLPTGKESLIP